MPRYGTFAVGTFSIQGAGLNLPGTVAGSKWSKVPGGPFSATRSIQPCRRALLDVVEFRRSHENRTQRVLRGLRDQVGIPTPHSFRGMADPLIDETLVDALGHAIADEAVSEAVPAGDHADVLRTRTKVFAASCTEIGEPVDVQTVNGPPG